MNRTAARLSFSTLAIGLLTLTSLFVGIGISLSAVSVPSFFSNYLTWTFSRNLKPNPYYTLVRSAYSKSQISAFVDVNGDNLPDFLYMVVPAAEMNTERYYAVFLNNGNNNFTLVYRCVDERETNITNYYGDCALGAPDRDPNASANQNMLVTIKNLLNFNPDATQFVLPDTQWLDLNGDGLQDYLKNGAFYINAGNATFSPL